MDFETFGIRSAGDILTTKAHAWGELTSYLESLDREDVIAAQERLAAARHKRPKGGQAALNALFRESLTSLGWQKHPLMFPTAGPDLSSWKLDFLKDGI